MGAYINALREEGTRADLLREIEKLLKEQDAHIQFISELAAQIAQQQSRIRELEEALRPFAKHGEYVNFYFPDNGDDIVAAGLPDNPITLGDFRRAYSVVNKGD